MSLRKSAASGVRWTTVSMIGITIMETVRLIVLARLLPPNAFGLMAMMIVVIGLGQIFSQMGLVQAVIQRPEPKDDELVSLYWLNIAAGLSVYALLLLATPLVAKLYSSPELKSMLPYVGLMFVFNPMGDLYRAMLEKKLHFKHLAGVELAGAFVGMVLSIVLAVGGFGVWSLIWGQLTTVACRNIGFFALGQKMFRPRLHFRKDDLQGYLRFGLHHVGAQSVNYFNKRLDQLLIGALLGPQALGYYSMAFNLIMRPVQRVNPVLIRVAFPILAKVQTDQDRLKRGYFKLLNFVTSINAPLLLGIAAVSPIAVPLLLGQKWDPIIPLVQLLCFYTFLRSTGDAGGALVLSKGRTDIEFYWNISLIIVFPAMITIAALSGELKNVALTLVVAQFIILFLWYYFVIKRILGSCFTEYIKNIFLPLGYAIVMMLSVSLLISKIFVFVSIFNMMFLILFGVVLYAGTYCFFQKNNFLSQLKMVFYK